jgi:hypothetical protein
VDGADPLDGLARELVVVLPPPGELRHLDALEEIEDVHQPIPGAGQHGHVQLDGGHRLGEDDLVAPVRQASVELVLRQRPLLAEIKRAGQLRGQLGGAPGVHLLAALELRAAGGGLSLVACVLRQPRGALEDLGRRVALDPAEVREVPALLTSGDLDGVKEPVARDASRIGEPKQEQLAEIAALELVDALRAGLEVVVEALVQLVLLALAVRADEGDGDLGIRPRAKPRARADRDLVLDAH